MYFGFTNYFSPSRVLSLIAGILGGGIVPLCSLAVYVFTALSLYTIAQRRGIACPWLAWIPVANLWLVGSLSDQYRYLTRGQIKHKRIILLVLKAVTVALSGGIIGAAVWLFFSDGSAASAITLLVMGLMDFGVIVAAAVLNFMALYDIYASCDPENAALFLVLSIFIKILKPVFLFVVRNSDKGMPPRKVQTEEQTGPQETI